MGTILITSRLTEEFREDLEQTLFFNPQQHKAERGIRDCVERFGVPELSMQNGLLRINVGAFPDSQALFLIDRTETEDILAGVIVYVRDTHEDITILHIAVAENYILKGQIPTARLVWDLLRHVVESASHITGVRNVKIIYGKSLGKTSGIIENIPVTTPKDPDTPKKSVDCPDEALTCFEYQRCFDCTRDFISKTHEPLLQKPLS